MVRQILTPEVIEQLNNLPGFPAKPTTNPPQEDRWILGDYLDQLKIRPSASDLLDLPATGNSIGDVRVVISEQTFYFWDGAAWIPIAGGGGGGSTNPQITGQVTAGLVAGDVCYMSAANTWSAAQADGVLSQATSLGVFTGTAGTIALSGSVIGALRCTTAGGLPAINGQLFLAPSTEDGGAGAGKVTATPPSGSLNLQVIGVCVDNAGYAGSKTVKAIFQPGYPLILES